MTIPQIAKEIRERYSDQSEKIDYLSPCGKIAVEGRVEVREMPDKFARHGEPKGEVEIFYTLTRFLVMDGNEDWVDDEVKLEQLIQII